VNYYRRDLALAHHIGFGAHADACAPGILALLEPIRDRDGLVLELGCGSGALTRHLVAAGHRVVASDAAPAMLDLAREHAPGAAEIRRIVLPGDPLPPADAVVSVGHVLNYLPDEGSIDRALAAVAQALRPGGMLVIDLCDREWGRARRDVAPVGRAEEDWAIITAFSLPSPERFVRDITVFTRHPDDSWRRDDERHENVLIDTAAVPARLRRYGLEAKVGPSFGVEALPRGLVAVTGVRRERPGSPPDRS
jgi:SAM-dependent methyltransferase